MRVPASLIQLVNIVREHILQFALVSTGELARHDQLHTQVNTTISAARCRIVRNCSLCIGVSRLRHSTASVRSNRMCNPLTSRRKTIYSSMSSGGCYGARKAFLPPFGGIVSEPHESRQKLLEKRVRLQQINEADIRIFNQQIPATSRRRIRLQNGVSIQHQYGPKIDYQSELVKITAREAA